MKAFACILATLFALASGQRRAQSGYGAPQAAPAAQPSYGNQQSASTLSQSQSHGGDHQGLDWLLESVPGQPGTDYPIYSQDQLEGFAFDCGSQIEGGYYADPASQCQAFHVCVPDALGGLSTQSFLCPNGTIFNQEYFICDWWFNFDCSQAQGLYSRNDEVRAEAEAASQGQASNIQNSYAQPSGGNNNNFNNNNAAPSGNSYNAAPAQSNYGRNGRK